MKRNRSGFGGYILELIILVIGISASFALNEWRLEQRDRDQEVELLRQFGESLKTDSTIISQSIKALEAQTKAAGFLLDLEPGGAFQDSVAFGIINILNYSTFNPSVTTYQEMKSVGATSIVRNKDLLKDLMDMYELNYMAIQEWTSIDEQHVINQMIPYCNANFPFARYLNFTALSAQDKTRLMNVLNEDEFKYMVQYTQIYKTAASQIYKGVLTALRELIDQINAEIEK